MSGYWSTLFYEDQNSWTSAVADVCSTIVSYGVDIPWCVCSNSWNVVNVATEWISFYALALAAFLKLEQWWYFEYSVILFVLVQNVPFMRSRAQGNWRTWVNILSLTLVNLAWLGCFLETAAGIQGGLVFGGKLFYPSLALLGLALQLCKLVLISVDREAFGWANYDESSKDSKVTGTLNFYKKVISNESLFFLAFATFGLPKLEANISDVSAWLFLFPYATMARDGLDYFKATTPESKDKNGDVVNKEAASPDVAAAVKKIEKKSEEEKDEKKEQAKKENVVLGAILKVYASIVGAIGCVAGLFLKAYTKFMSLQWDLIFNVALRLGNLFTYTWIFWTLTEDLAVVGFPLATYVVPLVLAKLSNKISQDNENLLRELCMFSVAGLQYYLFKTNILQY